MGVASLYDYSFDGSEYVVVKSIHSPSNCPKIKKEPKKNNERL